MKSLAIVLCFALIIVVGATLGARSAKASCDDGNNNKSVLVDIQCIYYRPFPHIKRPGRGNQSRPGTAAERPPAARSVSTQRDAEAR